MKKSIFFFLFITLHTTAQNLYKTPSGSRYHLASCRMVKNVSKKVSDSDISRYGLSACKICKPPYKSYSNSFANKAVGKSSSVRCNGRTKRGTRCEHKTRLANGYCYQHTNQQKSNYNSNSFYSSGSSKSYSTSTCGARTKSGRSCRKKVKGGGYCYQHR